MMRRLRKRRLGRRGSTGPVPGCGVLLKKLRSRWLVFEPRYSRSSAVPGQSSRWTSRLHWSLRALGRCRVGEMTSGAPPATTPSGCSNDSVGLAASELNVDTAANGGLLVRNVNEFIWFGL